MNEISVMEIIHSVQIVIMILVDQMESLLMVMKHILMAVVIV